MLRNFLAETTEKGVGIPTKSCSGGEEVSPPYVKSNPLFVPIATAAFDVTCIKAMVTGQRDLGLGRRGNEYETKFSCTKEQGIMQTAAHMF